MISTEHLKDRAVRQFVEALNARDERAFAKAVVDDFTYTCGEETGGAADFFTGHTEFVAAEESREGDTLTGFVIRSGRGDKVQWAFRAMPGIGVIKLDVTTGVEIPADSFSRIMRQLGTDRRRPPEGTLRRLELGDHYFVHKWERGLGDTYDWINTGEKAVDPDVYRTFDSPAKGDQDDCSRNKVSRVTSRLTVQVGWGDTYQKATVRFHAKPYYAEPLVWREEHMRLVDESVPTLAATLTLTAPPTLTAPEPKVVSTEEIKVIGTKPPYPLDFTREFTFTDLPLGTYTLALTDARKNGGYWSSSRDTTVMIEDRALTFTIGD
ncbi:hypothetical protein [Kitasatospora sp. NPDC090091]|uniref:hypothetical protein n=1 Tax=Kitasatospora sp. NPDC090091 TaxID=3364081 RepID=UPI00382AADA6